MTFVANQYQDETVDSDDEARDRMPEPIESTPVKKKRKRKLFTPKPTPTRVRRSHSLIYIVS